VIVLAVLLVEVTGTVVMAAIEAGAEEPEAVGKLHLSSYVII